MMESKPTKTEKKTYTKPKVTEVRLVPDEAVLNLCKEGNSMSGSCATWCSDQPSS